MNERGTPVWPGRPNPLGATWGEIDMQVALWTIPAGRMKADKEHRVPLSEPAMAILQDMAKLRVHPDPDTYVFPGAEPGRRLSDMALLMVLRRMGRDALTVHGFRSTFKDWASEATDYRTELSEMALAHSIDNKVEGAYRRGNLLDKRRQLMTDWATFCDQPATASDNVRPIRGAEAA